MITRYPEQAGAVHSCRGPPVNAAGVASAVPAPRRESANTEYRGASPPCWCERAGAPCSPRGESVPAGSKGSRLWSNCS